MNTFKAQTLAHTAREGLQSNELLVERLSQREESQAQQDEVVKKLQQDLFANQNKVQ